MFAIVLSGVFDGSHLADDGDLDPSRIPELCLYAAQLVLGGCTLVPAFLLDAQYLVEGIDELNRQHRALGNNINQLARLANSGQVQVVGLNEFLTEYQSIGKSIIELLDRKRWR